MIKKPIFLRLPFTRYGIITPMCQIATSLLDVGVGDGFALKNIRRLIRRNIFCIGVDIYIPNLLLLKKTNYYDGLVCCDMRFLPFRCRAFDVVLMLEVLEHIAKDEGIKTISYAENIAKIGVVISTPVGYYYRQPSEGENPYEKHKAAFIPSELRNLGYKVYGVGFRCRNKAGFPFPVDSPQRFLSLLASIIFLPILLRHPEYAERMVALKYLSNYKKSEKCTNARKNKQ
jgi:SAM-dependent methyltransferase